MNIETPIAHQRLIVISNRLPIILKREPTGGLEVKSGTGGLVTALAPVLKNRGGVWVGWPGMADLKSSELEPIIQDANKQSGFFLEPVLLTNQEVGLYYQGFANEILW